MARTRVITRTVIDTVYEVMTLNTCTCDVEVKFYTLGAIKFANEDKALSALKKQYDTEDVKLVKINGTSQREQIYGILETDFMAMARLMDSDRHFIGDDTEIETEEDYDVSIDNDEDGNTVVTETKKRK